nr:MAG TPA: hypothetical protein [Caudoviricetes sp.]
MGVYLVHPHFSYPQHSTERPTQHEQPHHESNHRPTRT